MRNLAKGPPMVINCIFWENEPDQMLNVCDRFCPFSVISFTDIQGGLPDNNTTDGGGNIDADPIFVDADGPDNIAGTEDDNLRLQLGSPCFNTGDNSVVNMGDMDLDGNPRIRHGNVDMGAYEYQSCDGYGDLDAVPGVHLGDFALFAGHWMETDCGACGGADFDGDHDVTLPDLLLQIAFWLCDGY